MRQRTLGEMLAALFVALVLVSPATLAVLFLQAIGVDNQTIGNVLTIVFAATGFLIWLFFRIRAHR